MRQTGAANDTAYKRTDYLKGKRLMKADEFDRLVNAKRFTSDLAFSLNGLSADEYIDKITDEIKEIDLDPVPIDKWDMVVTFLLATLESAGDFFIGDPSFKSSLANKNGPFCKWLDKFHQHQAGSPMDYQGEGFGGGAHRAKTFAHDILCFALAIYSISSGKFIDCSFTKDGRYKWIVESVNQNGNPYDSCSVFVAIVRYLVHMLADFCSSASLPIPGFSLLTHFPDRDVEAFAMKLYRNGMNLRTMAMQGVPVAMTELLISLYVWIRSQDGEGKFPETAWEHKKHKLLLISHGITTAVNVGKVVIAHAPWRLNLVVIARTFQLTWKVVGEATQITNNHILKLDEQILRAWIESSQTLVLLDGLLYETDNLNQLTDELSRRMAASDRERKDQLSELKEETSKLDAILED